MQDSGGSGDPRAWAGRQALIKLSLTTTVPGTSRECLFQGASAGISIAFCMLQFPSPQALVFGTLPDRRLQFCSSACLGGHSAVPSPRFLKAPWPVDGCMDVVLPLRVGYRPNQNSKEFLTPGLPPSEDELGEITRKTV